MLQKVKNAFANARGSVSLALFAGSLAIANTSSAFVMAAGWEGFEQNLTTWFKDGLGGPGLQGIGTAIAVIGIVAAIGSFFIHKFNPQSRIPGPIMCLSVALVGTIAMSGLEKPMGVIETVRDTLYGWVGI